jgi:hypothetical protein
VLYGNFARYDQTTKTQAQNNIRMDSMLPLITYSLTSMSFNQSHAYTPSNVMSKCGSNIAAIHLPIPYTLNFSLYIRTKTRNDMYDVLEQIIPYFNPTMSFKIKLKQVHNVVFEDTMVLTMNDVSERVDNYDEIEAKRKVEWQIDFQMDAWLFKTNHLMDSNLVDSSGIGINNQSAAMINTIEISFSNFNGSTEIFTSTDDFPSDQFLYN